MIVVLELNCDFRRNGIDFVLLDYWESSCEWSWCELVGVDGGGSDGKVR